MVGEGLRGMAYAENNRVLDTKSDRHKMVAPVLHERNGDSILERTTKVWRIKELCPVSVSRGDIPMTSHTNKVKVRPSERISEIWLSKQIEYEACSEHLMTDDMRRWFLFDSIMQYLDEQSTNQEEEVR